MRITALDIDGFGIFREVSLADLPPGLVLLAGRNEAGKSTLLGFIRTVLFGFPRGGSREPAFPPLRGGSPGGRISLATGAGAAHVVERRPGKGGGTVTVLGPDGRSGGAAALSQLLGGLTREVFANVYAFSLGELQSIDTLQDESVKGVIYGASAGTAMLALPRAEKTLEERMAALFRPGGSKPSINARLREVEALRSRLRELAHEAGGYDAAAAGLRASEEGVRGLQEERETTARERRRLDLLARLWPSWLDLREAERALRELPEQVERFPAEGLATLERERLLLREHEGRAADLRERLRLLAAARDAIGVDEALLARAEEVEELARDAGDHRRVRRELPVRGQEERLLAAGIRTLLDGLGHDWTEERVLDFDRSVFTRESVRRHQEQLRRLEGELRDAATVLAEKEHRLARAAGDLATARAALAALPAPEEQADERVLQALVHGRSEIAGILRDLPQRAVELRQERQLLDRLVAEIDPSWTAEDLARLDRSIAARTRLDRHREQLRGAEEGLREAALLERARAEELERLRERQAARSRRPEVPPPEAGTREDVERLAAAIPLLRRRLLRGTELRAAITHLEERLRDREEERRRLPAARAPGPALPGRRHAAVVAAAGIAAALVAAAAGEPLIATAVGGALLLVAGALALLARGAGPDGRGDAEARARHDAAIAGLQSDVRDRRAEVRSLEEGGPAGVPGAAGVDSRTWEGLDALEQAVKDGLVLLERRQRREEEARALAEEIEQAAAGFRQAAERSGRAAEVLDARRRAWREELERGRLHTELSPELVSVILGKVETAVERRENVRRLESRIREMEEARDAYRRRAGSLPALAAALARPGADLLSECDRFFERQERARAGREERAGRLRQVEEREALAAQAREEAAAAARLAERVAGEHAAVLAAWQGWLTGHGLAGDLSPETALEALDRIEECAGAVRRRRGLAGELRDLRAAEQGLRDRVAELCAALGRPAPAPERVAEAAEQLGQGLREAAGNRGERAHLDARITQARGELEALARRADGCREAIAAALREAGAADEREFRDRGALFAERERILAAAAAAERSLRQASGESDLAALRGTLERETFEQIRDRDDALRAREEQAGSEAEELRQRCADLRHTVERLAAADEVARLRAEEERLRAEIRREAAEWAAAALARELLTRAREQFETDQQPRVIREAAAFFRTISGGRYRGIVAPLGEETIMVETEDRQRRRPEELSRGTAEQLYLALRFGFIRIHAERNDPLPVIMDDVLVNFDPERALATAGAILELSRRQQVLFLTCHPETVELFRRADPGVRPIRIDAGRFCAE